jgi:hypothetical protein
MLTYVRGQVQWLFSGAMFVQKDGGPSSREMKEMTEYTGFLNMVEDSEAVITNELGSTCLKLKS